MSFGTYWRMTINNYSLTDVALIRQGYPDDIRKLVYTFEVGKEGTPHIQAFIQMKRSVRMAHMKKLFPRGNFATMDNAEWRLNQHNYAQKLDATAASGAVIQNSDPLHTIEGTVRRVCEIIITQHEDEPDLDLARRWVEKAMVEEDYTMAKVFVSSTYRQMWLRFGGEILANIYKKVAQRNSELIAEEEALRVEIPTHTHTHAQEEIISHDGGITPDASDDEGEDDEESQDVGEGEDYESDEDSEGSEDEGYDEGRSTGSGSSDAGSEY